MSKTPRPRAGAFILNRRVGQGAMGEVWHGVHAISDVPVAVKVLKARAGHTHSEALRQEVRAMARLHHPSIVAVLDYGEISEVEAGRSGGALVAGSPYVVMEYASGGALSKLRKPLKWSEVRAVILCLLDALGHAHARGLIHRDIKPANVLLADMDDLRPGLKLSDFGIAHALEPARWDEVEEASVGTPRYMAPEQFDGLWRTHGPWTDLYALGGVAYELATGDYPYDGRTFLTLAIQHRTEPPPRPSEDILAPPGFRDWVAKMMAKRPEDRFQCAADAAWALLEMESKAGWMNSSSAMPARAGRDAAAALSPVISAARDYRKEMERPRFNPLSTSEIRRLGGDLSQPPSPPAVPLPKTWRPVSNAVPVPGLVGAGLELYGLRSISLVGRFGERNKLWSALSEVHSRWRSRLVLLRGASGVGKSHLARWLGERAEEIGGAVLMQARHTPTPGLSSGLPAMLARHLRCVGLSRLETLERVDRTLSAIGVDDKALVKALTVVMEPALGHADRGDTSIHFQSPSEWYEHVCRYLEVMARARPVIVWLDDVQWGRDALAFSEYLMERSAHLALRVMIVATLDEEPLVSRPQEAELLEELLTFEAAETIQVAPLPESDCTRMLEELLTIEGALAARLARRCGGLPMFALQLVGDWVARGVLSAGRHGFVLKEGDQAELPENMRGVWADRVQALLADRSPESAIALEIAAALGQDVDSDEWSGACACAGISLPPGLDEVMISARFAERTEQGWRFVHGMLREALEQHAEGASRWQRHNLACALMVSRRYGVDALGVSERLGRHFLAAREHEVALRYLMQGAEDRQESGDHRAVLALAGLYASALREMSVPESDMRWGRVWLLQATALTGLGKLAEANTTAVRAEGRAIAHGWRAMGADTARVLGEIAVERGDLVEATTCFKRALGQHQSAAGGALALDTLRLGEVCLWRGELTRAAELLQAARALLEAEGKAVLSARSLRGLGSVALRHSDYDKARAMLTDARDAALTHGDAKGALRALRGLGDTERLSGSLGEALALYLEVEALSPTPSGYEAVRARLGRAQVALQRRQVPEAQALFHACRIAFERPRRPGQLAMVHAMLVPCAAFSSDWQAFDKHLNQALDLILKTGIADPDIAIPLGLAAQRAVMAARPDHARRAVEAAQIQWRTMGRTDMADDLGSLI